MIYNFDLHFLAFDEYMKKLTPENNARNFWFQDYWEDLFDCNVEQNSYNLKQRWQINPERHVESSRQRRKLCNPKLR
jgi:hypothetical protein